MVAVARALAAWIRRNADRVTFNSNPGWGSVIPEFRVGADIVRGPFRLWSEGIISITFQYMVDRPVFGAAAKREELRRRLNAIDGIVLGEDAIAKRPTIRLDVLAAGNGLDRFLGVMDWFVAELRRAAPSAPAAPVEAERLPQ